MDPTQTPTVAPTGDPNAANLPVGASPAQQGTPVNPAQAPSQQNQNQNQQQQLASSGTTPNGTVDVSAMIAQYESRIRNLMSEKDKALNERNVAINAQVELQKQLTEYQSQASTSLQTTAEAAQHAINESSSLRARVSSLEAELARAKVVLARPELADYIAFIPAESDPEKLNAAVEQLAQIRANDLARAGVRSFTPAPANNNQMVPGNGLPPTNQTLPNTQQSTATTTPVPNPYALYGQRPNVSPMVSQQVPGSSPAMLNPSGAGNTLASINQILQEAMESGDPGKFQAAIEQTKVLAAQDINRQLGRA